MAYYNAPTPIPSWGTTAESTGGILKLAKGEWAPGLWAGSEGATIRITGPTIVVDVRVLSVDLNKGEIGIDYTGHIPAGCATQLWVKGYYDYKRIDC